MGKWISHKAKGIRQLVLNMHVPSSLLLTPAAVDADNAHDYFAITSPLLDGLRGPNLIVASICVLLRVWHKSALPSC